MIGAGVMAAVDAIVFHQFLQWHHFFDRRTPAIGVLSDGLLHAAELLATVAGADLLIRLARAGHLAADHAWPGFFVGLGGFPLFDGAISHKILRIHQIRYGVDLLLYDLVWNAAGAVPLAVRLVPLVRARRADRPKQGV